MKTMRYIGLIGLAAALFAVRAADAQSVPEAALDQFTFGEPLNDVEFRAEDLRGHPVILQFWGADCPPCVAFLPELTRLHRRHGSRGLKIVGIHAQRVPDERVLKLLEDANATYPVLRGGQSPIPFRGIPRAFVFNRGGQLLWTGNPHDRSFDRAVRDAMR